MVKPLLTAALFAFSYLPLSCLAAGERQCFFPNGELAVNHYPCNPDAANGPCCDSGYTCLGNNLCQGPKKDTIRGSCTDKTWIPNKSGGACNRWCFGDGGSPGAVLVRCSDGNENETGASWCCGNEAVAGSQWYWLDWSVMKPVAEFDSTQKRFNLLTRPGTSLLPSSTRQSGSASTPALATSGAADPSLTNNPSHQETVTKPVVSGAPGAVSTGTSSTGPPSQSQSSEGTGLSTAAYAGIGAGAGVLVLIIALLVFFLWKRNKRGREEQSARAELDAGHGHGEKNEKGQLFELSTAPHYELYGSPVQGQLHPWESPGWNHKELPTEFERMEMDAGYYPCAEPSDNSSWTASRAETLNGSSKGEV